MKQRLIDANELKEEFELKEHFHYYDTERYRDYENEWVTRTVEHGGYDPVSVVNEAPTVEAIPIEWVNKYIDSTLDGDNSQMLGFKAAIIKGMIEEWEKENDTYKVGK